MSYQDPQRPQGQDNRLLQWLMSQLQANRNRGPFPQQSPETSTSAMVRNLGGIPAPPAPAAPPSSFRFPAGAGPITPEAPIPPALASRPIPQTDGLAVQDPTNRYQVGMRNALIDRARQVGTPAPMPTQRLQLNDGLESRGPPPATFTRPGTFIGADFQPPPPAPPAPNPQGGPQQPSPFAQGVAESFVGARPTPPTIQAPQMAPTPSPMAAAPPAAGPTQPNPKDPMPPQPGQQMDQVLKDQLIAEALRITRERQAAELAARKAPVKPNGR